MAGINTAPTHDLERQEGESDKAWLAFVCYRDLGSQRSVQAAYIKYIEAVKPSTAKKSQSTAPKSQSPASEGFKKWVVQFNWSERVRSHDAEREGLIRDSLLKTDRQKYLDSIENFRLKLESGGLDSISASTIVASRLAKEAAAAADSGDNRMTEKDLALIPQVGRENPVFLKNGKF
jgi:hypothetical protein